MKLACLLALAALPAFAQAPSQFRASAPLTIGGTDALHQVELPFEAYRDARRDLADVRVFNAAGEAVPFAWAGEPDAVLEAVPPIVLPLFPISRMQAADAASKAAEVTIRASDGTLVMVRGARPAKSAGKAVAIPVAYLLDASKAQEPLKAIAFDWKAGVEVATVRVEASDDLKAWSRVASAPLVRLESEGRTLSQPRVEFNPRRAKYYRVTWEAPGFVLNSARGEHEPRGKAPARHVRTVPASPGEKAGDHVFDLGGRLPVEALRIVPAQGNAVLATTLYSRDDAKQPWRLVGIAAFYRLQRDGVEAKSPPIEIGRRSARYWMARLAAGSSPGEPPSLEAHWRSAHLVFVAQGEPPFSLAFASEQAQAAALPIASVVPRHAKGIERRLHLARVGPVRAGPPPTRWEQLVGSMNPRRIALWAILVVGVILLGVMAWRLSKQV